MKKKLVLIAVIVTILSFCIVLTISNISLIRQKVFKVMTVKEFLYDKNPNRWNELYINKEGNVSYKDMVIIKDNGFKALCDENVTDKKEIKILYKSGWYKARGVTIE